jgi:DNA-binding HxlR family transcriptional regulator
VSPDTQAPAIERLCNIGATLEIIGGRWKAPILFFLLRNGARRFSEIRRFLPGVTQRMLTLQLRDLERDGAITREVFADVPPRVEYALTPYGRTLEPVLLSLRDWGAANKARVSARRRPKSRPAPPCLPLDSAENAPAERR